MKAINYKGECLHKHATRSDKQCSASGAPLGGINVNGAATASASVCGAGGGGRRRADGKTGGGGGLWSVATA